MTLASYFETKGAVKGRQEGSRRTYLQYRLPPDSAHGAQVKADLAGLAPASSCSSRLAGLAAERE